MPDYAVHPQRIGYSWRQRQTSKWQGRVIPSTELYLVFTTK